MERIQIYENLLIFSTIASSLASLINLLLIYDMGIWSGFLALITTMAVSQLLYDVSFYPNNSPIISDNSSSVAIFIISSIFHCFGGVTQAIASNIISIIVLYTVKYQRSIDIFKHVNLLAAVMVTPSLVLFLFYFLSLGLSDPDTSSDMENIAKYGYFSIRIASIVAIAGTHLYTHYLVYRMTRNVTITSKDLAIQTLIRRLQWYPIIQAVSRSVYSFYELNYTFLFNPFSNVDPNRIKYGDDTQFTLLSITVLLTPITAVGYLVIFLWMQPNAYKCLISRLTTCRKYLPPSSTKRKKHHVTLTNPFSSGNTDLSNKPSKNTYDDYEDHELLYELSMITDDNNSSLYNYFGTRESTTFPATTLEISASAGAMRKTSYTKSLRSKDKDSFVTTAANNPIIITSQQVSSISDSGSPGNLELTVIIS